MYANAATAFAPARPPWEDAAFSPIAGPGAASGCRPDMLGTPTRLRQRREFLDVARDGRKHAAPGLVLQAMKRPGDEVSAGTDAIRVGFTVTKKIGNAVKRNRVRRRLRAAADRVVPVHGRDGYDLVLIGRAGTANREFPDLVRDLETAMRKLGVYRQNETE